MTVHASSEILWLRTALLACVLTYCCALAAQADEQPGPAKPYPLENCVVSNDKIDPLVPPVLYNGQEYRFCCRGCVKKFNRDPEKYAARLAASTNRGNAGGK